MWSDLNDSKRTSPWERRTFIIIVINRLYAASHSLSTTCTENIQVGDSDDGIIVVNISRYYYVERSSASHNCRCTGSRPSRYVRQHVLRRNTLIFDNGKSHCAYFLRRGECICQRDDDSSARRSLVAYPEPPPVARYANFATELI